jgi:hypothetical protein
MEDASSCVAQLAVENAILIEGTNGERGSDKPVED